MSEPKDVVNFGYQEAFRMRLIDQRGATDNSLSEEEFIAQVNRDFDDSAMDVLHACETCAMNGGHDDISGDVETFYHFYRVHRWIVTTDNQGFKELETYDTEREAKDAFQSHDREYMRRHDA